MSNYFHTSRRHCQSISSDEVARLVKARRQEKRKIQEKEKKRQEDEWRKQENEYKR